MGLRWMACMFLRLLWQSLKLFYSSTIPSILAFCISPRRFTRTCKLTRPQGYFHSVKAQPHDVTYEARQDEVFWYEAGSNYARIVQRFVQPM